ncbi:hypothetical protein [Nonomuraea zeae]|uniref:Uncharacterized protein n=1 Tax=Nonomuraea zeae TaxID=1642303 RepID=A0A5S4GGS2_9ACTN|nr:hypothetical protein [Nonomuraea zeae]TMR31714.1 hypothetical protein ETD85_24760 [Nonomuraea zeae]
MSRRREGGGLPPHQVDLRDQRIHVQGLGHAYLGDDSTREWPYHPVEVEYRHVQVLQDAVPTTAAGSPA